MGKYQNVKTGEIVEIDDARYEIIKHQNKYIPSTKKRVTAKKQPVKKGVTKQKPA